jgi:hypothetical protein
MTVADRWKSRLAQSLRKNPTAIEKMTAADVEVKREYLQQVAVVFDQFEQIARELNTEVGEYVVQVERNQEQIIIAIHPYTLHVIYGDFCATLSPWNNTLTFSANGSILPLTKAFLSDQDGRKNGFTRPAPNGIPVPLS